MMERRETHKIRWVNLVRYVYRGARERRRNGLAQFNLYACKKIHEHTHTFTQSLSLSHINNIIIRESTDSGATAIVPLLCSNVHYWCEIQQCNHRPTECMYLPDHRGVHKNLMRQIYVHSFNWIGEKHMEHTHGITPLNELYTRDRLRKRGRTSSMRCMSNARLYVCMASHTNCTYVGK